MASLRDEYPAYAAFIDSQNDCTPCQEKMKKARAARGQAKSTPDCPECYNFDCGAKCRDALSRLVRGDSHTG